MKCKLWKGEHTRYAHTKLDGHWLEIYKDGYGRVMCTTSRPTDITTSLRHCVFYSQAARFLPQESRLYGELYLPGQPASKIKTAIKEREQLRFAVFAVPTLPVDATLEMCEHWSEKHGQEFAKYYRFDDRPKTPEQEGYVFKDANLLNWQKWKPVKTIDLIVTGYTEGTGKYLGLIGALVCSTVEGHVLANVSGMDDKTRILVSDEPEKYLGKICEVRYQYVGTKGRLRHPAFVRWRDDKSPERCGIDQDSKLEVYYKM